MYRELEQIRPVLQFINEIASIIFKRPINELSARDEDIPLQGIFSFLKSLLEKYPDIREVYPNKNELLEYLVHDCLFHKETRGQMISKQKALPPKCKHSNTREKCLELLNVLSINNQQGV